MNETAGRQWPDRTRRKAGAVARWCLAFLLVLQIAYTPFHLYLEPHADEVEFSWNRATTKTTGIAGNASHDDHGDGERHPAAQHKLKVLIANMDSFSTEFLNIVQRTFSKK